MKKIIKRLFAGMLLTGLVTVSGLMTILFFPEPLFANALEHRPFTVYSNEPVDNDVHEVLDSALALVKRSELYDPEYTYDIFLSERTRFNAIDSKVLGHGPSARAMDNNIIVKVAVDFKRNVALPAFYEPCEANLTRLLAHEVIHCLQANKYGKIKFNPFRHPEFLKLEGYPEYISRWPQRSAKGYSLVKDIERYLELKGKSGNGWIAIEEGGCKAPDYYYRSKLMMEYLMDVRRMTYDKVLRDTVSADSIYKEMMAWREKRK
jgi:hypothetical protein